MSLNYQTIKLCRACKSSTLKVIYPFGDMPLADGLRFESQLIEREEFYPLTLAFCEECSLTQILENVSPEIMFSEDYPYFSSFSDAWVEHCRRNAKQLIETRQLDDTSLVIEIASNDGYMLKHFHKHGVNVLGIEPTPGPAKEARKIGIDVREDFFTSDYADKLVKEGLKADVVIANNVLAHVPDLFGFVQGAAKIVKSDGVVVVEAPYVRDLIDQCQFDTIYHEHHCYFSLTSLSRLFASHGLHINHVEHLSTHGGSLRIYAEKINNQSQAVVLMLAEEESCGLTNYDYYEQFAQRVKQIQSELTQLLLGLKKKGKRVVGYAAAAKGAMLLNSLKLPANTIDYVVDKNIHKQGRYMPGLCLEIKEPKVLLKDKPDYLLVLAWNLMDEIVQQQSDYARSGGRFICPIPQPEIKEQTVA